MGARTPSAPGVAIDWARWGRVSSRWLAIITPVYWAWAAFSLETRQARRMMLAGSVALFVACFLFILQQDAGGPLCLWHSGNCGPGWFN